jgi:lipoprotein-anchoring transpeptidase ErfK/SrfK
MIIRRKLGLAAVAAASLATFTALQGRPAAAQLLWDWGGDDTVGGSGRQVVAFNPQYGAGQIIVSFGDRKLYYVTQSGQAISYPIAVPREKSRWEGITSVSQKRVSPSWTPTPTMLAENPRLPRWVPGGHPMNPLGVRALYLGSSMYRIHGTDAPWTIGTAASKGCIRLYNQDVLDLYPRVNVGAKVTVTYQTFTTAGLPSVSLPPVSLPPVSSLSNAAPKSIGSFLFGDEPASAPARAPARRTPSRAKSKTAAPAKSAAVSESVPKSVPDAPEAQAPADKNAEAAVVETAVRAPVERLDP